MLEWSNEATAVLSVALMVLAGRGYVPHLRFAPLNGTTMMRWFVLHVVLLTVCRASYWDIAVPALSAAGLIQPWVQTPVGQISNSLFNIWSAGLALTLLAVLHHEIPEGERGNYSWLTAPFYPRRLKLWRRI